MIGASLYIIVCSARNRARLRLRRLREPRYLAGAIAGAAYLYFSIFGRLWSGRSSRARNAARGRRPARSLSDVPGLAASGPALSGIALLLLAGVSWLAPFDSGLLAFSEAEIQFLFPAPVSRRQLLIHRMLRSQLGLLFGAVIFGIALPSASGSNRLRVGVGVWILMSATKVYYTGVSLTRARIAASRGRRAAALLPVAVLLGAVAVVAVELIRAFWLTATPGLRDVLNRVGEVAMQPLPRIVLWPFTTLTAPLFAAGGGAGAYLTALAGAAAVLAMTVVWMLWSDETLQEAAAEAAARRSRQPSGRRTATYRARSAGWTLAPVGRAETAFAWKGLLQTLRVIDGRGMARITAVLLALTVFTTMFGREGPAAMLGAFAMTAAVFAIVMAPQILRVDLRQDLEHLELLKTWPVRAAVVVRGELLWPGAAITAVAWTMIAMATILSGTVLPTIGLGWRMSSAVALAILAPALVFAQLTVHNAVALMFPAWLPLGNQRARGVDALGQRLIMLGGTWLLLIVMAVPGALAGAIVWFALGPFVGPVALVPAAVVCTAIIAAEVLLATEALGPIYERLDLLAVERVE